MVSNIVLGGIPQDNSIGDQLMNLQQQQILTQRRQQQDEDDKVKFLADQLDFKNFATGTAADPVINNGLNGMMQKYMQRVKENKGESLSSLLLDMQKDLGGLKQYSINAQGVRKGVEARGKEFGENKDIDAAALQRDAMASAFFKTDPTTGAVTMKSPDEIDPNADYTGELLKRQKGRYLKGRSGLYNYIKGMEESALGGEVQRDKNGLTKKVSWTANLKPFEEFVKDAKGNPSGTRIMQDKPVKIGDKEVIAFPKEAYDKMFGGQEWDMYIDAELDDKIREIRQQDPRFDITDPRQIDILKRSIAYDYLKAFRPNSDFKEKDIESESAFREKLNAGYAPKITINTGGKGKDEGADYVEAYKDIDLITDKHRKEGRKYTQTNLLSNKAQDAVLAVVRSKLGSSNVSIADIKLTRDANGNITVSTVKDIFDGAGENAPLLMAKGKAITTLDKVGVDMSVNKRKGEQEQIIKDSKAKTYKGLDAKGNPIFQ